MKKVKTPTLQSVWAESKDLITKQRTDLDLSQFNELIASIFCPGPFCFFVTDFYDMRIVMENVRDMIPIEGDITLNGIISMIHPDDMAFVSKAEEACISYLYKNVGADKALKYKLNYCFRAKSVTGDYRMYSRQGLILTIDDKGAFGKTLNIITDITHITSTNNYKISLVGLKGEPSYLNIDIGYEGSLMNTFSSREIEIVKLIAQGMQSKEIAESLNLSLHTVNTHRKNILAKSGMKSMNTLISRCSQEGLI